ncbi:M56 family metallopeptidase [Mucilaginibacter ginsenosidivorax]|uniref:M56 family metallopeptidase n=1 Tax=Mucilaginibacter ginsenosidivorax TaxID=862126 RepID=A0A5B8W8E0_9SPHI|nr:M56 family metallopeptidase [Mucilaginibacter ginsenosidivorax]QEC79192.1 M56 family metallopeptidase [Mucilaginibacter ginsenosidivorax]
MIPYLLHVALLITICLLFYKLFLQRETFYNLNRWVLLICLPLSFLLPLIHVPQQWSVRATEQQNIAGADELPMVTLPAKAFPSINAITPRLSKPGSKPTDTPKPTAAPPAKPMSTVASNFTLADIMQWLFIIYIAGVVVFALNLLIQLIYTLYTAYARPVIIDGPYRIVELTGDKVPCSFLNNIFINPEKYDWDTYNQILVHEKVHARQLHSIDILLTELVIVLQWFNPFAWWYRTEMENNLEYLTDEAVTSKHNIDRSLYQLSLLKVSAPHLSLRIATNYNQSILKKRILMMSIKKSNLHTLWKYFLLVPLFAGLACILNQPAIGKNRLMSKGMYTGIIPDSLYKGDIVGFWYANKEGNVLNMDMKIVIKKQDWSYNGFVFPVSAFSSLPLKKQSDFYVKRNAGTILFNGKFEGDQGLGRFKMTFNKTYLEHLQKAGVKNTNEDALIGLVVNDVKEDYINLLIDNGFKDLTAEQLSTLALFKVTPSEIKFWGHSGFKNLTARDLQRAKSANMDSSYVSEIKKAGYPDITFNELCLLKSDSITADYIKGLTRAKLAARVPGDTTGTVIPVSIISTAKYMHVDSAYLRALAGFGYDLTASQLHSFKNFNITPEYITGLQNSGYSNIPASTLLSLKISKITPEYIKGFHDVGYNNIPLNALTLFKSQGITPDLVMGYKTMGYTNIEPTTLVQLKVKEITPGFIKGFSDLGFKNIPLTQLFVLKNTGVTPAYVTSMKQKGLNSKDIQKYITLKNSFN